MKYELDLNMKYRYHFGKLIIFNYGFSRKTSK